MEILSKVNDLDEQAPFDITSCVLEVLYSQAYSKSGLWPILNTSLVDMLFIDAPGSTIAQTK